MDVKVHELTANKNIIQMDALLVKIMLAKL